MKFWIGKGKLGILDKLINEKFPNLIKLLTHRFKNSTNIKHNKHTKNPYICNIIVKLLKISDEEKILKSVRRNKIWLQISFQKQTAIQVMCNDIFKVLKKFPFKLEFYIQRKYISEVNENEILFQTDKVEKLSAYWYYSFHR